MKKAIILFISIALAATASAAEPSGKKSKGGNEAPVVWQITEGLKAPESAYVDPESGFLFLSQIGEGGGKGKDGDGWISKMTIDGKMLENKWVTGFDSPKGLRSHDGVLWLGDEGNILYANAATGRILGYDSEQLQHMSVLDVDPDADRKWWIEHWNTVGVRPQGYKGQP